jgi:predicted DNA-binding transcriptional regulator YafY
MRKTGLDIDRSLDIHIALIQFFRDGHCTTAGEIAQRYGVGERTAQRMLLRIERYVPLQRTGPNYRKAVLR